MSYVYTYAKIKIQTNSNILFRLCNTFTSLFNSLSIYNANNSRKFTPTTGYSFLTKFLQKLAFSFLNYFQNDWKKNVKTWTWNYYRLLISLSCTKFLKLKVPKISLSKHRKDLKIEFFFLGFRNYYIRWNEKCSKKQYSFSLVSIFYLRIIER